MCDDVPKKKEYLRDSREKLNKAIKVNADAVTPDGERTIFQLVNAFCEEPFRPNIRPKGKERIFDSSFARTKREQEKDCREREKQRKRLSELGTDVGIPMCIHIYI